MLNQIADGKKLTLRARQSHCYYCNYSTHKTINCLQNNICGVIFFLLMKRYKHQVSHVIEQTLYVNQFDVRQYIIRITRLMNQ